MPSMENHPSLVPQVEQQQIQYRQDGPGSLADSFTIVANASEVSRQSHPRTLFITILPRSTKGPRLKVNAGLQVREGRYHGDPRTLPVTRLGELGLGGAGLPPRGEPWGMGTGGAFSRRGEAAEEAAGELSPLGARPAPPLLRGSAARWEHRPAVPAPTALPRRQQRLRSPSAHGMIPGSSKSGLPTSHQHRVELLNHLGSFHTSLYGRPGKRQKGRGLTCC